MIDIYPDVLMFIGRFSTDGQGTRWEVVDAFTRGCCWWFAFILKTRFADQNPEIVIDLAANHFACRIQGRVYDIRGDITDMGYEWQNWDEYDDPLHKKRIADCCINF